MHTSDLADAVAYPVCFVQLPEGYRVIQPRQSRVSAVDDGCPGLESVLAWQTRVSGFE